MSNIVGFRESNSNRSWVRLRLLLCKVNDKYLEPSIGSLGVIVATHYVHRQTFVEQVNLLVDYYFSSSMTTDFAGNSTNS
jgi:hypothetical protein